MAKIKFSQIIPQEKRRHVINPHDVTVLLGRLPAELWSRLRAVHFNDRGFGVRWLGYVTRGRSEIAICALPPRVSLTPFLRGYASPQEFGARRGAQWPHLAVRRFMLYNVFLHELGHLQIINPSAKTVRRKFADEKLAQRFADKWRRKLWAEEFEHPDPIHNRPSVKELTTLSSCS